MADAQDEARPSDLWRQGDVLPDALAASILDRLADRLHLPGDENCGDAREFLKPGVLVLISQDCDLVQPSWATEPFCEAIWGSSAEGQRQPDAKSPRAIRLHLEDDLSGHPYTFKDCNRVTFTRRWLSGHASFEKKMGRDRLRKLIRMVLRRYDRQPLPTAFNDRLKACGVDGKIEKLLRNSQEALSGVAIYLRLSIWKEPSSECPIENYIAYPVAVYKAEKDDTAREDERKRAADEIMNGNCDERQPDSYLALGLVGLLKKCNGRGIVLQKSEELADPFRQCDHVLSERHFTLDHRHEFKAWEFDHLSPGDDDATPISTHSVL